MPKRITVQEIASQMEIDRKTVYAMLSAGQIPAVRAGKIWIVSRAAFERWFDNCGASPSAKAVLQ